mgnify:CR=1 FL=1
MWDRPHLPLPPMAEWSISVGLVLGEIQTEEARREEEGKGTVAV